MTAGRQVEQNWWTSTIFECNFDQAWSTAGKFRRFQETRLQDTLEYSGPDADPEMPQSVFVKIIEHIEPPKMQHEDVLRFS